MTAREGSRTLHQQDARELSPTTVRVLRRLFSGKVTLYYDACSMYRRHPVVKEIS